MVPFLDSTILAALEDAVLLGVDAVNMSLGASAGFADTEETAVQGRLLPLCPGGRQPDDCRR